MASAVLLADLVVEVSDVLLSKNAHETTSCVDLEENVKKGLEVK